MLAGACDCGVGREAGRRKGSGRVPERGREVAGREAAEPSADPETELNEPFLGIPGAFRVFYAPQDRPRSTISGLRGVWVGGERAARLA